MADKQNRRGLGRGLSALMADVEPAVQASDEAGQGAGRADRLVPIEKIFPNPDQPRRTFTPDQLSELADSIRTKGVIQPIIVRERSAEPGTFEIVAGERRWRASQMAELHEMPVLVREFSDIEVLEVAIIENIQRADLNAIEEAAGYRQLMYKFGHTQEKLAEALGKSRSHIANLLRLLNLPQDVQEMVGAGDLSAGHARALITAQDPLALARRVVAGKLSVRETEKLAKIGGVESGGPRRKGPVGGKSEKDADTRMLEGDLSAALGMKVSIDHAGGGEEGGHVSIRYKSLDELDILCGKLGGSH